MLLIFSLSMMRFRRSLRSFKFGKLIVILVILVIFLQILHMIMIARFESKDWLEKTKLPQRDRRKTLFFKSLIKSMEARIRTSHRLDNSGTYHIIDNIVLPRADRSSQDDELSIVTQCSSNHLDYLVPLTGRWGGPVSVSVFTFDTDVNDVLYNIAYYHLCNEQIRQSTSFHLVYPIDRTPVSINSNWTIQATCDKKLDLGTTFGSNYDIGGIPFPHNLLRNLAIRYTKTPYVLMIDIDMLPSIKLKQSFHSFFKTVRTVGTETLKTAFVLPAFEVQTDIDVPSEKAELLIQWGKGNVRPFYRTACWKCQKQTQYERWKKLEPKTRLEVAYSLSWKDPWEPFFIGDKSLPDYDERFKQYGFNRISQVCEMHIAGFQFSVLNNAFLVHHGFKEPKEFHKTKEDELNKNRLLFRRFKEELKVKYPESDRRCY
ncbi:beta-1,4-glucuronyltransferase 1-like [Gigantopelta aegis]|uniref:beta-1,4-glucuronyltransferase 1-like n=1 Tax=Gigantopelta aegis TaxID=1735272 RepID=UPI001B88B68E|nr:beta-1,4-glucuronyltransferase 1-like [Gigantopelta aegis]